MRAHLILKDGTVFVRRAALSALSGASALRGFYTSGILMHRPDEDSTVRRLEIELRNGPTLAGKLIDKVKGEWVELNPMNERLARKDVDAVIGKPMGIPKTGVFGLLDLVGGGQLKVRAVGAVDHLFAQVDQLAAQIGVVDGPAVVLGVHHRDHRARQQHARRNAEQGGGQEEPEGDIDRRRLLEGKLRVHAGRRPVAQARRMRISWVPSSSTSSRQT